MRFVSWILLRGSSSFKGFDTVVDTNLEQT